MIFSFVNGATKNLKQINDSNLVICIVPFTFSIFPAYWLAKKTKSKLWVHIQDFEFDLAFESGILSKQNVFTSLFKYLVLKIESYLLNKANVTSSISQQMLSKITEKSKDNQPFFFPNWISEEFINPDNSNFHAYFQSDKFNVLYSGNVGEKQDWDLLIETAKKLENYSNIVFIIVGSGTYIEQLKFKTKDFKNIVFKDLVPYSELNDLLCSASLHFLFQKKEVLDTLMPSKLLGMMASKVPCIVTGHEKSEISKILTSDTGIYLYNPTASLVSEKIIELSQEKEKSKILGENARTKIIEMFSKTKVLNNFNEKINAILNN
jgi:colanic acid biosynthesis glycosyl transferase WcaI